MIWFRNDWWPKGTKRGAIQQKERTGTTESDLIRESSWWSDSMGLGSQISMREKRVTTDSGFSLLWSDHNLSDSSQSGSQWWEKREKMKKVCPAFFQTDLQEQVMDDRVEVKEKKEFHLMIHFLAPGSKSRGKRGRESVCEMFVRNLFEEKICCLETVSSSSRTCDRDIRHHDTRTPVYATHSRTRSLQFLLSSYLCSLPSKKRGGSRVQNSPLNTRTWKATNRKACAAEAGLEKAEGVLFLCWRNRSVPCLYIRIFTSPSPSLLFSPLHLFSAVYFSLFPSLKHTSLSSSFYPTHIIRIMAFQSSLISDRVKKRRIQSLASTGCASSSESSDKSCTSDCIMSYTSSRSATTLLITLTSLVLIASLSHPCHGFLYDTGESKHEV